MSVLIPVVTALFGGVSGALLTSWMHYKKFRQDGVVRVIDWMEDIRLRPKRQELREAGAFSTWNKEVLDAAYEVSRHFDRLGILDSNKHVDRSFVDKFYAIPAIHMWDLCREYVEFERKKANRRAHLWEFEQLALRVRHVEENHPTNRKSNTWAPFPRRSKDFCINRLHDRLFCSLHRKQG